MTDRTQYLGGAVNLNMLGAGSDARARDNVHALRRGVEMGGHLAIMEPGTYTIDQQIVMASDVTIEIGAGVTLDASTMPIPCLVATSKSNVRLTGDGKILCVAASVPTFTNCTGLEVSVRIEDASGRLLLQSLLNNRGRVSIRRAETIEISDTLIIYSDTCLELYPGATIKLANSVQKPMLQNYAYTLAPRSVTGITVVGTLATVNIAAHGRAVNDWVSITGSSTSGINGTYQVISVTDANNYTVRLHMVPSATTAVGTILEKAADHDISIVGEGYWDGNKDNRTAIGSLLDVGIILAFVGRVHLDIRGKNHIQRFIFPACFNGITGRAFASNSVGTLIFNAPGVNLNMSEIVGVDQTDDIYGHQGGDYTDYQISMGDAINCYVGRVSGRTDNNAIKIAGSTNFVLELEVGEVEAESTNALIKLTNDTQMVALVTTMRHLRIGSLKHINPKHNTAGINVASASGTCTLTSLVIDNVKVIVPSGVTYRLIYPDNANAVIGRAKLGNVDIEGAAANQTIYIADQVGTFTELQIANLRMKNCGAIFVHDSTGSESGQIVQVTNARLDGCSAAFSFRRALTVHLSNFVATSTGNGVFSSGSAGAVCTVLGDEPVADKLYNLASTAYVAYKSGDVTCTLTPITATQMRTLAATPVAVVPAPGASKANIFLGADVLYDYGTAAYDSVGAGDDIEFRYTDGAGTLVGAIEATGFLDATSDQYRHAYPQSALGTVRAELTPTANAAIVCTLGTGEVYAAAGDSPLYVRTWTRLRDIARPFG